MVTSELSNDEIIEMTAAVVAEFGVSDGDVTTEVQYLTSGTLEISVDGETSEDEVADAVVSTLAELLDVHPRDVTIVSVDLESGEVLYEVATPNYTDAIEIQFNIETLEPNDIEIELQHKSCQYNKNFFAIFF